MSRYPSLVRGRDVEVVLLVDGRRASLYRRLDGRMFAAVTPGAKAQLSVRNLRSARTEVLVSFDGRNLLHDEPASLTSPYSFVLQGSQAYVFDGWRVDDSVTREIVFGSPATSVEAQAEGETPNVGVIGVASYQEAIRIRPSHYDPSPFAGGGMYGDEVMRSYGGTKGVVTRGGSGADQYGPGSLGAGIGAEQVSQVGRTTFARTGEADVVVIGYDTEAELIRRGIITPPDPQPFAVEQTGYQAYTSA